MKKYIVSMVAILLVLANFVIAQDQPQIYFANDNTPINGQQYIMVIDEGVFTRELVLSDDGGLTAMENVTFAVLELRHDNIDIELIDPNILQITILDGYDAFDVHDIGISATFDADTVPVNAIFQLRIIPMSLVLTDCGATVNGSEGTVSEITLTPTIGGYIPLDCDNVEFEVLSANGAAVTVDGCTLTYTPETDWYGDDTVTINATYSFNGSYTDACAFNVTYTDVPDLNYEAFGTPKNEDEDYCQTLDVYEIDADSPYASGYSYLYAVSVADLGMYPNNEYMTLHPTWADGIVCIDTDLNWPAGDAQDITIVAQLIAYPSDDFYSQQVIDTETISITVNPVCDAPVITSEAEVFARTTETYTYQIEVTDVDDEAGFDYSLSGAPDGMTVSADGLVSWVPESGGYNTGTITATVADMCGGLTDEYSWDIYVYQVDCAGVDDGEAYMDECGNCVGGTTGLSPCAPEFTDFGLEASTDLANWNPVDGNPMDGFSFYLDPAFDFTYFNVTDVTTNIPLAAGNYGFFMTTYPYGFFDWWADHGVTADAEDGTWQAHAWQVINGNAPSFYLAFDGESYMLLDGILLDWGGTESFMRMNGDYLVGAYTLTGTVTSVAGVNSDIITVSIGVEDCNGDIGGAAVVDDCGVCSGGETGHDFNSDIDCNDDCFGTAFVDDCGVCSEGNTGHVENSDIDCNGDCFGTAQVDECGVCCDGETGTDCSYYIDDTDFGGAYDCAGECFGEYLPDCNGECGGLAMEDACGICAGGSTGLTPNEDDGTGFVTGPDADCAGVCFGESVVDDCEDCVLPDDYNAAMDCNGDCDGTAYLDDCGVCSEGNTGHDPNSDDLGCGCFNPAALTYCFDYDGDGLGNPGTEMDFCLDSIEEGYVADCSDESPDGEVTVFLSDPVIDDMGAGTIDVLYSDSDLPVRGYQFALTGVTLTGAASDNDDFTISFNPDNGMVVAFSANGGNYAAGDGVFATITLQHAGPATSICIEDFLAAGESGHGFMVHTGECIAVAEAYMDCNGDYFGSALPDDCGVCSGGNSGHEPNVEIDCAGECFGEHSEDGVGGCCLDEEMNYCGICFAADDGFLAGDADGDCDVNIVDIVEISGWVLFEEAVEKPQNADVVLVDCALDFSSDGAINVADAVAIVGWIVDCNGAVARNTTVDATYAQITQSNSDVTLTSDGYVGGIQMVLSHEPGFELNLTGSALFANYNTDGTRTTVFVINPEEEVLFTTSDSFTIESVIVAGANGEIETTLSEGKPTEFRLGEAYPNPFNPSVSVDLQLAESGYVSVKIYNLVGQVVSVLSDGVLDADYYTFTWNAGDQPSGIYIIRVDTNGNTATQKVMLVK